VRSHKTDIRGSLVVLLVALSVSSVGAAKLGSEATLPNPSVDLSKIRIDNFGRVNDSYYRGAQPQGPDYADLASLGIRTVVDLTSDDSDASEPDLAAAAGLKLFKLPMTTHEPPTSDYLQRFLAIVSDPANQPVYVHCVGGRHRTGVMTAVYRMTQDGWNAHQAFREMKQYKYGADFLHAEFKQFVYGYRPRSVSGSL
jgi:tyrosine-protein phosphatase SIW14